MKAILVIDEMPSECGWECPCYRENNACEGMCTETLKSTPFTDERPSWCPLKPLPKKKNTDFHPNVVYANGWNDCLKEIKGD